MRWKFICGAIATALLALLGSPTAHAENSESTTEDATDERENGPYNESNLQLRIYPPGIKYRVKAAYRVYIRDAENILFQGRHIDTGLTSEVSPTFLWAGPYVELLPVAVLKLRAAAFGKTYFGTFGHLHVSETGDGTREARNRTADENLAQTATGWRLEFQATPQILVGPVAVLLESSLHRMSLDIDHPYYEPSFGLMFEPLETIVETNPTIAYVFGSDPETRYAALGIRWEHSVARHSGWTQDKFGVIWNIQLPEEIMRWGDPVFAGYAAMRRKLPGQPSLSPFLGIQFTVEY